MTEQDKYFIKDVNTGNTLVITGPVYIKHDNGDMQIPFHYMVEILDKELKSLIRTS